jgi:putative heme transporter
VSGVEDRLALSSAGEHPGEEPQSSAADGAQTAESPPTPESGAQASVAADAGQAKPDRVVVPRWVQLVLLPLALLALWALARAAGKVLLVFIVAGVIALILNPAVAFLKRRTRLPRGLSVLAVYLAFFLVLAGVGFLLANPISNQVHSFSRELPHLVQEANKLVAEAQGYLDKHGFHVKLVKQGKTALQTIQDKLTKSSSSIASTAGGLLTEAAGAFFDLILTFVLSVYMLIYAPRIGTLARRVMPDGDGSRGDDYPKLVQRAVSRYVGGQLLFSVVMGTTAGVALYIYGVLGIFPDGRTYALAFGAFLGVMELIPYVGPFLGAMPPILVALVTDPISALWVALLFLGIQQLEGHLVAPQIFGHTLRINPLLVIFALLMGNQLYGILGAIVALPILSVLRETVLYLSRHLTLEPWERAPSKLL